jgi:ABC-2 type transport system ATP-binding protein
MAIHVTELCKHFVTKQKKPGFHLFNRYQPVAVPAVNSISFSIQAGERVAFIGPNGAGKSTTLKMLSGIMTPTSGAAQVAGLVPWQDRKALAYHIGLVFGQRSQLWYHLPVRHSFELLGKIYGLSSQTYQTQLALLEKNFSLTDLLDKPVKSLSLGQRMRCEIAASLIHDPKILFLDEPTIGLDVTTKAELREHLKQINAQHGTTIILTSHDTDDIEQICDRVILINHGEKLIDAPLQDVRNRYLKKKQLRFVTEEETPHIILPDHVISQSENHVLTVELDPDQVSLPAVISQIMQELNIKDMSIHDRDLEDVIRMIYTEVKA